MGDTILDAAAAHAGGAIAVGVMTEPAPAANLVPEADAILASAEEFLRWLYNQ